MEIFNQPSDNSPPERGFTPIDVACAGQLRQDQRTIAFTRGVELRQTPDGKVCSFSVLGQQCTLLARRVDSGLESKVYATKENTGLPHRTGPTIPSSCFARAWIHGSIGGSSTTPTSAD